MKFSGEDFSLLDMKIVDNASPGSPKSKGGRPTIPDNFLLGSRNRWLSFFEECWPDIGWPLLRIRKRRPSTIADMQKIFEPMKEKQRCELAAAFLGDLPDVTVSAQQLIRQRKESSKLRFEVQDMQNQIPELELSLREAANALSQSTNGKDRAAIAAEGRRRAQLRWRNKQVEVPLKLSECKKHEAQDRAGETYIYCSQLRDFLRSVRRAVTPLNLANALAGLPDMRWRQSDARCSKMPEERYPLHSYAVFLMVERLCKRVSVTHSRLQVDLFRSALAKLPASYNKFPQSTDRDFLCQHWRDFRLAVEEVHKAEPETGFIPYALTATFLRNANRPKTSLDSVMDTTEALVPKRDAKKRKIGVLNRRAGRARRKAPKKKG